MTEIVVDQRGTFQLLGGRSQVEQAGHSQPDNNISRPTSAPQSNLETQAYTPRQQASVSEQDVDAYDDDLPF